MYSLFRSTWDFMGRAYFWIFGVFAVGMLLAELSMRKIGGDPLWDYQTGLWQLARHTVARADVWAQGHPGWVNPEWAWANILALAGHFGYLGWVSVSVLGFIVYGAGLFAIARLYDVSAGWRALGLGIALITVLPWFGFRPQVWAYGLAVWAFWLLSALVRPYFNGGPYLGFWRFVVPLAFMTVAWAQIHGSWLLVPVWLVLEAVLLARSWRVALSLVGFALLLVLAVSVLNPYGWAYITHSLALSSNPVIAYFIAEWMSPNFHVGYIVLTFAVFSLGGLLGVLGRRWVSLAWQARSFVYLLGFIGAALYAVRFFPYLPIGFFASVGAWRIGVRNVLPAFSVALALLAPVWIIYSVRHMPTGPVTAASSLSRAEVPVGSADLLQRLGVRRVFAQYRWGGYLEAKGLVPWIDGRGQMWSVVGREQLYVSGRGGLANPLQIILRSGNRWALLSPGNPYYYAVQQAGWVVRGRGYGWTLFQKGKAAR